MKILLLLIVIFSITILSCYYDSEEVLYPELGSCDTTNVTFATSVMHLLENNCLSCHSNNTAASLGNNVKLESYADISSKKSLILSSIKMNGSSFTMPKGAPKLKDCLIQQFEIWVNNGAPDN